MSFAQVVARIACVGCGAGGTLLCSRCSRASTPAPEAPSIPGIVRALAKWDYSGLPRKLLLDLKLGRREPAAAILARGIFEAMAERGSAAEVLAWVPARRPDIRDRGFDHAEAIARALSLITGLPCRQLLRRTDQAVPDQAGLSRSERLSNLEGAFDATRCAGIVGLVDDVITTGATARSCSAALRRAGARAVDALVACRV